MTKITAILTVWKRDHIEEQLDALMSQSYPPGEIWVYHCCNFVKPKFYLLSKYQHLKYNINTHDLGYFGRFSLALHVKSPYVIILDDDVVPGKLWLENSIEHCEKYNSIISPAGRLINKNYNSEDVSNQNHINEFFIGDNDHLKSFTYTEDKKYVGFGCNSWFFKREWIRYFWSISPFNFDTGEDIHFSATAKIFGRIKTLCPVQNSISNSGNIKKLYGFDHFASWKKHDFVLKRGQIIRHFVEEYGWSPESVNV